MLDKTRRLERLVKESGITFQIELELHYNPVVIRTKELIENEAMGKMDAFNATNITLSPVWAFPWQGVPEKSYGKRVPIKEVTKSEFDVIFAKVAPNMRHEIEEEDMLAVVGRMKNGVIFSLDPSWSRAENKLKVPGPGWEVFPKRMEVNLVIHGNEGSV